MSRGLFIRRNGKRVYAHRWLMEQVLGRKLLPTEHVHHKDHNPRNNAVDNLEVLSAREHMVLHHGKPCQPRPCAHCQVMFTPIGHHRHRQSCCSPECAQALRVHAALKARGLR